MGLRGRWIAGLCTAAAALALAPAPASADRLALADKGSFYAWGTITVRQYDTVQDNLVGGGLNLRSPDGPYPVGQWQEPDVIKITIDGGSPNVVAMRDAGIKGLKVYTDHADWRHGTTFDYPRYPSNPAVGTVFEFVGHIETTLDGGRNFVADIARPHEFAVAEHQDNVASLEITEDDGGTTQTYEGSVTSGPLTGWHVRAVARCEIDGSTTWTATDPVTGDSLYGRYTEIDENESVIIRDTLQLDTELLGGTGAYAGRTGGARLPISGCNDITTDKLFASDYPLELDIAA